MAEITHCIRTLCPSLYGIRRSLWTKIEGVDAVIDFGCADGSMIRMLSTLFPGIDFIGYDSDQEMIGMARKKNKAKNVEFFWKDEIDQITRIFGGGDGDHICLNFSSVLVCSS